MKFKKLLFIIVVFLAGTVASTVASTVTDTLFSNEETNNVEVDKIIFGILNDPLFILLTGGGITSLLIPRLTDKIQDRKENFEIKKELMVKINKSTTKLLVKIKMLSTEITNKEELHKEFFNWRESCSEIGATVRIYWSGGKGNSVVLEEWNAYYKHVDMLYRVITNYKKEEEADKKIISFLKKYDHDIKLEYESDDVKEITNSFFNEVKKLDTSKTDKEITENASKETDKLDSAEIDTEKYSKALGKLVHLFDKRKYYLLKLVFNNKIKNH